MFGFTPNHSAAQTWNFFCKLMGSSGMMQCMGHFDLVEPLKMLTPSVFQNSEKLYRLEEYAWLLWYMVPFRIPCAAPDSCDFLLLSSKYSCSPSCSSIDFNVSGSSICRKAPRSHFSPHQGHTSIRVCPWPWSLSEFCKELEELIGSRW